MGNLGWTEILLIFLVILLVFGAKRIPEIARGLGKGIREFKDATQDIKKELTVPEPPPAQLPRPGYGQPEAYGQAPHAQPQPYGQPPYAAQAPAPAAPYPPAEPAAAVPPPTAPPAEGPNPPA